jgi:predicted component of type VI protein secretion system
VAKLLIFRGESLLDERELTERTVRIGRAPQNDIVLEDPGKGVSREHAELRFEGGHYALFDRDSQNGIWVAGTRVPFVVLDPDVSVAVGPYRLMVKGPAPAPLASAPLVEPETAAEATQLAQPVAPLNLEDLAPLSVSATDPIPPPPAPAVKPAPKAPKPKVDQRSADPRVLGGIAAAILLVAVTGYVGYRLTRKPPPAWNSAAAQALIASGKCDEAVRTQITPALTADPNNQEARALREQCQPTQPPAPPPAGTTSVPAAPSVAERLTEAEGLLAAKDCQKARDLITGVLAEDQTSEPAKALLTRIDACLNPAPVTPGPAESPAVAIPAAQGGLEVNPNENDKAYKARVNVMGRKYEEALTLLQGQKYSQARKALDEIASQVPNGYRDLAQRREEAIAGMRAEARNAFDAAETAAKTADKASEFDAADRGYLRAHEMDPGIQVDAARQQLKDRRTAVGEKKCTDGTAALAFGRSDDGIPLLQEAVKLLPATNTCAGKAKQLLQGKQ